jgi:hypothetical protein
MAKFEPYLPSLSGVNLETLVDRFYEKVQNTGDCWLWTGSIKPNGYGQIGLRSKNCDHKASVGYAHRLSYELFIGEIPSGKDLDHLCRNRRCVNPDHLEPVTRQTNLLRGDTLPAKLAAKTHCKYGHPFTEENTKKVKGGRECVTCRKIYAAGNHRLKWGELPSEIR